MKRSMTLATLMGGALFLTACLDAPDDPGAEGSTAPIAHRASPPRRVLIVLFDQMVPAYADQFHMPNFRRLRDEGTNFREAHLGYMASETVIAHNVITSGMSPRNMGWVDEAYRDVDNLLGKGAGAMHLTGSFSQADFDLLVAGSGDIAVRTSSRSSSSLFDSCRATLGGRYRFPAGRNVPAYLTGGGAAECNRFYINSDASLDYGTAAAFPSWLYPEDGNRMFAGLDPAHLGGDNWVTDAALAMMINEDWSGMFVSLGAIDKAAHMWGAQADTASPDCATGPGQTHVRCAAENADVMLGRLLDQVAAIDASRGGETLVVLTADHGATYGQNFHGKTTLNASSSNWYYAPTGTWDGATFVPATDPLYNQPSPALLPLIATGNVQFSYQSTAIETWLIDRSTAKKQQAAAAGLTLPGAIATYYRHGARFRLHGTNPMTRAEK
jgi:hypothetical protein